MFALVARRNRSFPSFALVNERIEVGTVFDTSRFGPKLETDCVFALLLIVSGANEANVVYFIDRVLDKYEPDNREEFLQCVKHLNEVSAQMFAGRARFASLSNEQQLKVITKFETFKRRRRADLLGSLFGGETNYFETMRSYVIAGFLSDPEDGGNRDMVGWQVIGYDGMAMHEPPFGFYDAELLKGSDKK